MEGSEGQHPSAAFAEVVDLGVFIDAGAPMPELIVDGTRAVVVFYAAPSRKTRRRRRWGRRRRSRDGTPGSVVVAGESTERNLGWVMFDRVCHVSLGPPNDEALAGHPLYGAGLEYYAAHEVRNSELVAELERSNRAHPPHKPGEIESLVHVIITFHDETLECLCGSWSSGMLTADFDSAVAMAAVAVQPGEFPAWPKGS